MPDTTRRAAGTPTHVCPGGCGAKVPHQHFACPVCWSRLPFALRKQIHTHYRRDLAAHAAAMTTARTWFRNHPLSTREGDSRG